jgi:hypothetical protein
MNDTLERHCRLEDVFEGSFIELLQVAPANPVVRALVLKLTGKLPAEECLTFEQIKDWVEHNCFRRRRAAYQTEESAPGIAIAVDFSEKEHGRASYSVTRSSRERFEIGAAELLDLLREAIQSGGGLDEVVEMISTRINDDGWSECDPSLDEYGDYDYEDHESSDSNNCETDFATVEIREAVLAFMRQRHPEMMEVLTT